MGKFFPPTVEEFHSTGIGIMDGATHKPIYSTLNKAKNEIPDVNKEPHYYRLGYFLANRSKYLAVGLGLSQVL